MKDYVANTWKKGDIISSSRLNAIENGIDENNAQITANQDAVTALDEKVTQVKNNLNDITTNTASALATANATIAELSAKLASATRKIEALVNNTLEKNTVSDATTANISASDKDLILTSSVTISPEGKKLAISAKSLESSLTVENTHITATVDTDVVLNKFTLQGTLEKKVSNAGISINNSGAVTISDSKFTQSGYNAVEIGLANTALPTSVLIENTEFGECSNNAVSVFAMAENGVITIKNCKFPKTSNVVRLSNRTNTHFTLNLINCEIGEIDKSESWRGLFCLEDYTSTSNDAAFEANQFGKVTINVENCTLGGKPIAASAPELMFNSKDVEHQLAIVCYDKGNPQLIAYEGNEDHFPVLNIK